MNTDEAGSPRHTRLHVFPGGMLETTDYGDDDCGGFYLELDKPLLPQRIPAAPGTHPLDSAAPETCRRVLELLREWVPPRQNRPSTGEESTA